MRLTTSAALLFTVASAAVVAQSQTASHTGRTPDIKWGPAPAIFPKGAEMAVLQGNPGGNDLFTVRLRLPDGYRLAPHTHPTDENVTVISGSFRVGMGSTFETKSMMVLDAGGFVTAPADKAHYAEARGVTVVQVHALGPFAMTYVNPADTPQPTASR